MYRKLLDLHLETTNCDPKMKKYYEKKQAKWEEDRRPKFDMNKVTNWPQLYMNMPNSEFVVGAGKIQNILGKGTEKY